MSYANIKSFGQHNQPPCVGTNNPLTYCMTYSLDRKFQHGGAIGNLTGPGSAKCQNYMGERCAQNWDGFCEYFYEENGRNAKWPNNRRWPIYNARQIDVDVGSPAFLNAGDQLLKQTAERKYCTFQNCAKICEPFDPTDPNSPKITYYTDSNYASTCTPVCKVDPTTIDADPVMNRMLANPRAAASTLVQLCTNGQNLKGTKLGGMCDLYVQNVQK